MDISLRAILLNLLKNADEDKYYGFNKHDALLSPFLKGILGWSKITRLIGIQFVMRFPINIRKVLGVPKSRNSKGVALFAHSYLYLYKLTDEQKYLDKATELFDILIENASRIYGGYSWGYQYPWQDAGFYAKKNLSNRVVTCWVGFAFSEMYLITKSEKYRDVITGIVKFLLNAPNKIVDNEKELCFSYVPDKRINWAVMDVSALTAKMLILSIKCGCPIDVQNDAARCMNYIINRQTEYGAWFYTDPPGDSHITHDNYHSGIILDTIYDYMKETGNWHYESQYKKGLEYYLENLFTRDGAPKWMNNKEYPYDIHGAAQGIITFSKASERYEEYLEEAEKILSWTNKNMLNRNMNSFYYQKGRLLTKRFTLLRWCNGWMSFAISSFLVRNKNAG